MKIVALVSFASLLSLSVACTAQTSNPDPTKEGQSTAPSTASGTPDATPDAGPTPTPACTPVLASSGAGVANPASGYCVALGYTLDAEQCAFPDGTSCEEWAFYRGECGAAHSFCNLHGGTVSNKVEDMGTWTASYAVCTFADGKSCEESAFARSCTCE